MSPSRRSLLAASAGTVLAAPTLVSMTSTGHAAGRMVSTAKWGIWNAYVSANTITLHGFYPKDHSPLPAKFDLSVDGGKTWPYSAGFEHDNGAWDSWIYNLKMKPGTYHIVMRDSADHSVIAVAPHPAVLNPNTAPKTISFTPVRFSTSLPNGVPIGVISATGGTPQFPLALKAAAANSAAYAIKPHGKDKWQVSIADQGKLVAGNNVLAGVISSGAAATRFRFTFPVVQGRVVPASAITFIQAPRLTNATPVGSPAFTVRIAGYRGGEFAILSQAAPADPGTNMKARYTITGNRGATTNTLSAQTEPITIVWTDGINTCIAPHRITVGNVLNTGPRIALTNQGRLSSVMADAQNDPLGHYKGMIGILWPGSYISGWLLPHALDGWNDNSFLGPQTLMGKPGVMPVMTQGKSWIPNGKGWIETFGWDCEIIGLEFANLFQSYPGEVGNFSAIKLNAGVLGSTLIRYVFAHNCTNGVLGGEPGQLVAILDCEFAKNGGGDGYSHNFYVAAVARCRVERVVSWGANVGHCGKIRAARGEVLDSVFADGRFGTASYLLDLPDGGVHVVRNCTLEKGPHAQNGPFLRYGEECQNRHPVNTLLVDGCTFINHLGTHDRLYNDSIVDPVAIEVGLVSGAKATAEIRNCTFYGLTKAQASHADGPNVKLTWGSGNRFLPLSEAPDPDDYMKHPYAKGGYSTSTTQLAPYHQGPMKGR